MRYEHWCRAVSNGPREVVELAGRMATTDAPAGLPVELTVAELNLVAGGSEDPIKDIKGIGENIESGKATPILF